MTAHGATLSAPLPGMTLRLLGRSDARTVAELLHGTSNESLHQRFFTVPSGAHLRAEIDRLTQPASRRHATVGAEVVGKLAGVASFERDADNDDRAELAILVDDSFQGRGIGRRLLERLAVIALDQQIYELTASVLASNVRMLRLARSMGGVSDIPDRRRPHRPHRPAQGTCAEREPLRCRSRHRSL